MSGWTVTQPSGSSSIRAGDDQFRSDKSVIDRALNTELYFDAVTSASSNSGGLARPGIARAFFGTRASLVTPNSADSAGRLYYSTDLESLHYLAASSHSTIVGGAMPYGARAVSVPNQGFASGTSSAISFSAEDHDVGGFFSATSTRMNVASVGSGRYVLSGFYEWRDSVHSGSYRRLAIRKNGSPIVAAASSGTLVGGPITLNVHAIDHSSSTTHFYELVLQHDAGVQLVGSDGTGAFSIQRIS